MGLESEIRIEDQYKCLHLNPVSIISLEDIHTDRNDSLSTPHEVSIINPCSTDSNRQDFEVRTYPGKISSENEISVLM